MKKPLNDQEDLRYLSQFTALDITSANPEDLAKRIRALADECVAARVKKPLLGMYLRTHCEHYESYSTTSEELLAIGETEKELRDRWNAWQKQVCINYAYHHDSYYIYIPPAFHDGVTHRYSGSTGGGYASVSKTVTIRPLKQFDDVEG